MSRDAETLHGLVRALRIELDWVRRTGIVVTPPEVEPIDAAEVLRELGPAEPPGLGVFAEAGKAPVAANEPPALSAEPPPILEEEAPGLVPGSSRMPLLAKQLAAAHSLDGVRAVLGDCVRCKLCSGGRRQIVFGVGNPTADLMFVGEAPGGDEDRIGEPFVGRAGQLLTKIIEKGMGLARRDVYIANIVKCRPRNNRDPEPDEVEACEPFLKAQIRVVQPRVLVALGRYSAHTLLGTRTPITRLRGKWGEYEGIPLMPTYHPAYLLRNPAEKRPVWEDIQSVMRRLGMTPDPSGGAS